MYFFCVLLFVFTVLGSSQLTGSEQVTALYIPCLLEASVSNKKS